MSERRRPRLYTIPPDVPFLPALARAMLSGALPVGDGRPGPADLADWTIFLPNRRTARELAAALLEAAPAQSQVLARIHPLGDVDEDEIALTEVAAEEELLKDLPPPVPPLARRFLLARIIREWAESDDAWPLARIIREHAGEAMKMARALATLIDGFENEEVEFGSLHRLLSAERPEHRLAARDLLEHVRVRYPQELERMGVMGAAARRARLIRARAELYRKSPPPGPVVAAGSTGSIPATATLLAEIARLPSGCVILPGLDRDMDEESWRNLPEGHPQYGLARLLRIMDADRSEVEDLPGMERRHGGADRAFLLSEAMRPAETTGEWRSVVDRDKERLVAGARGMRHIHAEHRQQEAASIALLMRHVLETPGKTAALVTPDRTLARQVRAELARWDIEVNDSAGLPLSDTPPGMFLKLLAEAALSGFSPATLTALAAHPFSRFGLRRGDFLGRFARLETAVLRDLPTFPGIDELPEVVRRRCRDTALNPGHGHRAVREMTPEDWDDMRALAERLTEYLSDLAAVFSSSRPRPLERLLRAHLGAAEAISTDAAGVCELWLEEAGETLALSIRELLDHAGAAPEMTPRDYAAFVVSELAVRPVRPAHAGHARLSILGLLEARLVPADVKILGGLNEDVWPPVAENDPFLNRPDRAAMGLPVPERRIGLTAHDFVQAAGNAEVWLTSSARIDQQPAVESRWLLRLQALLQAAGAKEALKPRTPWTEWAVLQDMPGAGEEREIDPPAPCPPPTERPARISVTRVRTLARDPYGYHAGEILGLQPFPPLAARITGRELGIIVHEALERFAVAFLKEVPKGAEERLHALFLEAFDERVDDPASRAWWSERFRRIARWIVKREETWRAGVEKVLPEISGRLELDVRMAGRPVVLSAKADRVDVLADGSARIFDYKTGTLPSVDPEAAGYDAQLDLEAAMLLRGAFRGQPAVREVADALYVRVNGGWPPGETRSVTGKTMGFPERAELALERLSGLLCDYGREDQPYLPVGHGQASGRPSDYEHLSRWREWIFRLATEEER